MFISNHAQWWECKLYLKPNMLFFSFWTARKRLNPLSGIYSHLCPTWEGSPSIFDLRIIIIRTDSEGKFKHFGLAPRMEGKSSNEGTCSGDNCLLEKTLPNGFRCQLSTGGNTSQWVLVTAVYARQLFPMVCRWQLSTQGNCSQWVLGPTVYERQFFSMGSSDNCLRDATLPIGFQWQLSMGGHSAQWVPVTTLYGRKRYPMGSGDYCLREATLPNGLRWQLSTRGKASQWFLVTTVTLPNGFRLQLSMRGNSFQWFLVTTVYKRKFFPMGSSDNCLQEATVPNGLQ